MPIISSVMEEYYFGLLGMFRRHARADSEEGRIESMNRNLDSVTYCLMQLGGKTGIEQDPAFWEDILDMQKRGYNMALEKEYDVILRSFNDEREYLLFWAYCSERNVEGYINEIISSELDDAIYVHGKDFNEFCTEFYELKRKLGNRYLESMRENLDYAQRLIVSTSAADDRTTDLFEEWVSAAVHWSLAIGIDIRDEVRAKASAFYDKCAYTEKEVNNKIVEIYFNESMSVFRSTYPRL